jgi:hypothetical protein
MHEIEQPGISVEAPTHAALGRPWRFMKLPSVDDAAEWTCVLEEDTPAVALSFGQDAAAGGPGRFVSLRFMGETYVGERFALVETLVGYTLEAKLGADGKPRAARAWARIDVVGPVTPTEHELSCAVSARATLSFPPAPGRALRPPCQLVLRGSLVMRL